MTLPRLLEGLTWRRIAWTVALAALVAAATVGFFINTYWDLLASALCVGLSIMLLVTIAGNLRIRWIPREARQMLAVVLGSVIGTIIKSMIKGRNPITMLQHDGALWAVLITISMGIGFGGVILLVYMYREQKARAAAEAHRAEAERQKIEKQMVVAQLKTMQAQVEPHFLFNTLATVQHLVDVDPPRASQMLGSLIAYLRAALPQMREASTSIGREFALARAYLEVLQVRMGPRLEFTIDLPPALADRPMPPMMLISLVENAIKHGLEPVENGGRIEIGAREAGDELHIQVANTGAALDPAAKGGTGLSNIRERLLALYGSRARLVMEELRPQGVIARIELPAGGD
ncbi:MAG: histidine kinase [Betaproteobacteria bacterium]|nr:histidine kinase [Betaproteobacteria bacterium]